MTYPSSSAGTGTLSHSATPVKSSIYTCRYRAESCSAPPPSAPAACSAALRSPQRRAAAGGGCSASKRACAACTDAATSVDTRANRFGAYVPPKPRRQSITTPARPSSSNHKKHWSQTSAICTGQK
eukprot:6199217-Pleurochrysis_carterae.AAC.1